MWNLPRAGIEPLSPALTGRLSLPVTLYHQRSPVLVFFFFFKDCIPCHLWSVIKVFLPLSQHPVNDLTDFLKHQNLTALFFSLTSPWLLYVLYWIMKFSDFKKVLILYDLSQHVSQDFPWSKFLWRWQKQRHLVVSDYLQPHGLLCPWNSPSKNIGVSCHSLL